MKFSRTLKLAVQSILSSKARSLLTMLGIIIGVGAVIFIVGLGNGMRTYMQEMFEEMGTNVIYVYTFDMGDTRNMTVDEMYDVYEDNQDLFSGMSPISDMPAQAKVGTEKLKGTTITGVAENNFDMKSLSVVKGRALRYSDMLYRTDICVVGSYIDKEWYKSNSVGKSIKIGKSNYEIVGVLEEKADSMQYSNDNVIYLPYTTVLKATNTKSVGSYNFAMIDTDKTDDCKRVIEDALFAKYKDSEYYYVQAMTEYLNMADEQLNVMVTILAIIAGISLFVGGIGIMNIMLVSVSERTNEIGIRKALGAKQRDIMIQFVIEAGTTSAIGGIIGIIAGYLLSMVGTGLLSSMLGVDMKVLPDINSVIGAFSISAFIGILFGYLPAKKAAGLNPIDALRHD